MSSTSLSSRRADGIPPALVALAAPRRSRTRLPRRAAPWKAVQPPVSFTSIWRRSPATAPSRSGRSRTVADLGERRSALLESVLVPGHPLRGTAYAVDKDQRYAQADCPERPPIMVCGSAFPLVTGMHSNPLRSCGRIGSCKAGQPLSGFLSSRRLGDQVCVATPTGISPPQAMSDREGTLRRMRALETVWPR
jgi:hypothetical protein